jgi:4-amino-4-deoxy-L-arabinose transferase-like glycosyltransferase
LATPIKGDAPGSATGGVIGGARFTPGQWILIVLVVILGILARFYRLDAKGLWMDEIWSVTTAYRFHDAADLVMNFLRFDTNPPLFNLFMVVWSGIGGHSDYWVRLPSAIASSVAIPVAAFVAWRAFGPAAGAAMAVLTAFSWPLLYYAQEARSYAAVFLVSICLLHVWLRILRESAREEKGSMGLGWLLGWALAASMLHIYSGVLAGFCFSYLAIVAWRRGRLRRVLPSFAVFLSLWAAWLVFNLSAVSSLLGKGNFIYDPPDLAFFVDIGAFAYHHPVPALLTFLLPLAVGLRTTISRLGQTIRGFALEDPLLACLSAAILPFAAMFLFSQVQPLMLTRYLIAFLPAGLLVVAATFATWRPAREGWGLVALYLAGTASLYWLLPDLYEQRHRPQTREAVGEVLSQWQSGEPIVVYCRPEWVGGCDPEDPGTGAMTFRVTRYLHYLNHSTLPDWPIPVISFDTEEEAAALADRFLAEGVERLHVVGARGDVFQVKIALGILGSRGYECQKKVFFKALAGHCQAAGK